MTQMPATAFKNSLEDALSGNWPVVIRFLMERPCLATAQNLTALRGQPYALRDTIADCYEISNEKADVILREIINDADSFENTAQTRRIMTQFWTELLDSDLDNVAGRRAELASVLQHRYGLSRAVAWIQIHQFFAHHAR